MVKRVCIDTVHVCKILGCDRLHSAVFPLQEQLNKKKLGFYNVEPNHH